MKWYIRIISWRNRYARETQLNKCANWKGRIPSIEDYNEINVIGPFRLITMYTMKIDLRVKAEYLYSSMIFRYLLHTVTFTNQSEIIFKIPSGWGSLTLFQVPDLYFSWFTNNHYYTMKIKHSETKKSQMMYCSTECGAQADWRISSVKTALLCTAHVFCLWTVVSVDGVLYWDGREVWGPGTEEKDDSTWKVLGQELAVNGVLVNTTREHITCNVLSQRLIYQAEVSAKQCCAL